MPVSRRSCIAAAREKNGRPIVGRLFRSWVHASDLRVCSGIEALEHGRREESIAIPLRVPHNLLQVIEQQGKAVMTDQAYFSRRAEVERPAAIAAKDPALRRSHMEMAKAYAFRAAMAKTSDPAMVDRTFLEKRRDLCLEVAKAAISPTVAQTYQGLAQQYAAAIDELGTEQGVYDDAPQALPFMLGEKE